MLSSIFLEGLMSKKSLTYGSEIRSEEAAGHDNSKINYWSNDYSADKRNQFINLIRCSSRWTQNCSSNTLTLTTNHGRITVFFQNYRPVSVLPAFSKVLEKVLYSRFLRFFNKFNVIFKSRIIPRNLHYHICIIIFPLLSIIRSLLLGFFMELSKAFDTADHNILLEKLHHDGVRGTALTWLKSCLDDRQLPVC